MLRRLALFRFWFLLILAIAASTFVQSISQRSTHVLAASGQIQPSDHQTQPHPVTSGSGIQILSAEIAGPEEVVTNAPYIATATIETVQPLGNNNRIVNRSTQTIMRDSKGRILREQLIGKVGSLEFKGSKWIFISDPSTNTEYILDPAQRTVRVTKRQSSIPVDLSSRLKSEERTAGSNQVSPGTIRRRQVRHESLGSRVMEQLKVEGQRTTSIIPAGLLGNERPFEISLETWYSPDLRVYVYRKRSDPRSGETIYRLTNIRRIEPNATLFEIPHGYKQISGPGASAQ